METVLIILAIVWVVIPVLVKSKQKQAKEQAERERLARQRAAQAPLQQVERARSVAQPVRTSPLTPNVGTSSSRTPSSGEGWGSLEGRDGPVFEGEEAHEVATTLKTVQSSLTQLNVSVDHEVTPSGVSGHAHQETSLSGVDTSCPPEKAPATQPAPSVAAAVSADSAFVWNPADARSGLVMAEILGPCLALRE
ncbi:MAG: hypothetical protein LLF75_12755 [Eubacteriales bacterium]|nr:hypothetical protein [Eubacteriales bacterium]